MNYHHSASQPSFLATTPPSALVLIAEDEPQIARILAGYLERDGYRTAFAVDGQEALQQHLALAPDLLLLDVQMPRVDGWGVLAEVRRRGETPVIMLTARDQDADKLAALRVGADDYIIKPFNPAEVVARVAAVLRRSRVRHHPVGGQRLRCGPIEIDQETYVASVLREGAPVPLSLTLTEFRLLAHLARTPRRVCSRLELLESCMPESNSMERTVDSHVSKLRKKLEEAGVMNMPASLRGVGYRLESD
ncbi:MAG: response regulator transcription factor [Burkholderiales bacterium]|uniref:Response regulator transcription factor n=1 Tax=Janthinobacterium tructae TaxID=2590869 RepID=A0A4Y6RA70_9BURK|nr:response regulator [Janthinobacterium tructae]MBH1981199.1 response regulator transcription factor [Burkholderiales bacterium]MBH2068328.1 response regulator transcription factor [Burkholderiales bacterium]QDG69486.1 response regulator transcription factor [Janthinobacterium tructae]